MRMRSARATKSAIVIIAAILACGLMAPQAYAGVTVEIGEVRAAALDFVQHKFGVSESAAKGIMKHYDMLNNSTIIDRLELPEGAVLDFVSVDGSVKPGEPMVTYEGSGLIRNARAQLFAPYLKEALKTMPPDERAHLLKNVAEAARRGWFIQPLTPEQRQNLENYRRPGEKELRPKAATVIRILVVLNNFPRWDDVSPAPGEGNYYAPGADRDHPITAPPTDGKPGGPLNTSDFRAGVGLISPSWSSIGTDPLPAGATNGGVTNHPRIEYTVAGQTGTEVQLKERWYDFLFNKNPVMHTYSVTNYYYANSHANISIEGNRSDIIGPLESHHQLDRVRYLGGPGTDYAIQPGTPVILDVPDPGGLLLRAITADAGTDTIACLFYGDDRNITAAQYYDPGASTPAWTDLDIDARRPNSYDSRRQVTETANFDSDWNLRVRIPGVNGGAWINVTPDAGWDLDSDQGADASLLTSAEVLGSGQGCRLRSMCYYTHDHIVRYGGMGTRPYQLAHVRNSAGRIDDVGGTVDSGRDHADRPKPYDHDAQDHSAPNMGYFESPESNGGHKFGNWVGDLGGVLADNGIFPSGYSRRISLYPSDRAGGADTGGTSGPWSGGHVFIPNSSVVLPSDAGLSLTAHELGHTFGFPDLYDLDFYTNARGAEPPLFECSMMGPYSVMAHGGRRVDAWDKQLVGWLTPVVVEQDIINAPIPEIEGTLENPVVYKLPGRPYYIPTGVPPGQWLEYFLVENRNQNGAAYFGDISPRGLYIYHVDHRFSQTGEWTPMVIIEQADGLFELEGNPDGQWGDIDADPFPGTTLNRFFTQLTTPNCYSHGWKRDTINAPAPKTEEPPDPPPGILQPGTSTDSFSRVANITDPGPAMRADLHVVPREVIVTGPDPVGRPDSAPQGSVDVPILDLHFNNDGDLPNFSMGDVELDRIRIDENGSSQTDTDVTRVSLWDDTDGDQIFDPANDTRIADGVFQTQRTVLSGLDYRIPLEEVRDLFVTYDINDKAVAGLGVSLGAGLASFDYIVPEIPGAVQRRVRTTMTTTSAGLGTYRFPINSQQVGIDEAPDTLTVTPISRAPVDIPTPPASKAINPGDTDVPILSLDLTVDRDQVEIDRVTVDETGTIDAVAYITSAKLYLDANADGAVDPADTLLEETTFALDQGVEKAVFDIHDSSVVVSDAGMESLLLTCSISSDESLPLPSSLQLRLEDTTYIHLVGPPAPDPHDIVSDENFPMESDLVSTPEPNEPPPAPANLTATAEDDGSIRLDWELSDDDPNKAGENDVVEYHIYRATDPADFVGATIYYAAVAAGETQYFDTNVALGVPMYYMMRAYDGVQEGPDSNIAGPVQAEDNLAPTFSEFDPAKNAEDVATDTNIAFTMEDAGSGIDTTTLVFEVNGVDVASAAETSITGSAARSHVEYDPPADFEHLATVTVSLQVADLAGNVAPAAGAFESYDFTIVPPPTESVAGLILDGDGAPEADVTVTAGALSATTTADGTYEITGLAAGTYEVTPTKAGRSFTPVSLSVTVPPPAPGINFTSALGYKISGSVEMADSEEPLAGVTVSDGQHTDVTGADGLWEFNDVAAGTYTITATRAGYVFDPPTIDDVAVGPDDGDALGLLFEASLETFDITGTVRTVGGDRLAGVQVDALQNEVAAAQDKAVVATATTNANGAYTLGDLAPGSYTVRPTAEDYVFDPVQREINLAADESNVDFVAAALYQMTIGEGMNLVGVPVRPMNDDAVAVFGPDVDIARWDPLNSPPYLTAPSADPLMKVAPGRGFWVGVVPVEAEKDEVELEIPGELVSDAEDIVMSLLTGWNMGANPYEGGLLWAQVNIPAGSPASNYGFIYDTAAGGYRLVTTTAGLGAVTTVPRNAGFWMRASAATQVTIEGPGSAVASAADPVAARQPGPGSWVIPVVARAAGSMDASSFAGVLAEAAANPAAYRIDNPPAVSPYVDLYFTAGVGRRLAVDVRDQAAATETWEFVVTTDMAGVQIEVSLPDLSEVPADKKVTLVDEDAGKRMYARTMPAYTYNSGEGGSRHFSLEVSDGVGGGLAIASATASATGGGQVAISYTLSADAQVSVQVLNIAGRPIAALATSQAKAAGANTAVWSGRSKSGTACPAGQYLVQITALADDGQSVQALVPVLVQR